MYDSHRLARQAGGVVEEKLGISDYGVAWISFSKGLVLGYAVCFFI